MIVAGKGSSAQRVVGPARPRSAAWLLLVLLLLPAGCRRHVTPARKAEETALKNLYGKDAKLVLKAPACSTMVAVPTTGWKPAEAHDTALGFTLPQAFQADTAPHFLHGGWRWNDGDREFDILLGDWGPRSFIQDPHDGCRTVIAGTPVLVVRTLDGANRLSLSLWPYPATPDKGSAGLLVTAVSPNLQDDPLLYTMASEALQAMLSRRTPAR
ncbi:MAG TPA: hypothetical protein VF832_11995 [Longimicrobiales bacterium]